MKLIEFDISTAKVSTKKKSEKKNNVLFLHIKPPQFVEPIKYIIYIIATNKTVIINTKVAFSPELLTVS